MRFGRALPEGIQRIVRGSFTVVSATSITFACSLIALALNTRVLGVEQFGKLALIQAYFSLISGLTAFDNWQPVVRLGVRAPGKIGLVLGCGVSLDICASVAAALISTLGMVVFADALGIDVRVFSGLLR
jgi:hypothetical protein